jgi:hypothetical protein
MHSQVIGFLGEALAPMTAIQAMEEYGVSQDAFQIAFQIFKKLVDMILGLEISFEHFLLDSHLNEQTHFLALQCTI